MPMESLAEESGYLFPRSFILKDGDDPDLVARPLHVDDFGKGYCEILKQLTDIEDVDDAKFKLRFREFQLARDVYFIVVIEDLKKKKVIAAGSLVVEKKVIHSNGKCGHIEDVVVDSTYRGKNLGKRIIDQLSHVGKLTGCYKVILDCAEKNVAFYQKCGYTRKEVQMVRYLNKSSL
eukprot:TRINITY_DN1742_c0_g1_i1.p2 TRINITY_DN1742_c0_g1~~TRINITY_DN1742_c0_g1_i1.p2  ORF type:complete len:177 (+),score=43.54 TRINITY_DN1742_c0_g1_i1:73-603(+)